MFVLSMIICFISAAIPSPTSQNAVQAVWKFHKCLTSDDYDPSNTNATCDEPEWRTEPITISFKDINSVGTMINLDLTGIDSNSNLNYDSPALGIEIESGTGAGFASPLTYFTMRPDSNYGSEFEPLDEFTNSAFCDLPHETSWSFARAVPDALESSVTIVLTINGNQACSWFEIALKLLKEYWYLAVAGGVFLLALLCCWIWCCGCSCTCLQCLFEWLDCCGCLECLDCCGCCGCLLETGAEKVLEMV